jgi:hypothetical protein
MQDLGYARHAWGGVTLPKDATSQEANHAYNERQQARRQRGWLRVPPRRPQGHGEENEDKGGGDNSLSSLFTP